MSQELLDLDTLQIQHCFGGSLEFGIDGLSEIEVAVIN
jgi:hypothetical protein